ncbi:MAG: hypothetical protein ACJA09_000251 [Alcanivorax sp.]
MPTNTPRNGNDDSAEDIDGKNFRFGMSQRLTPKNIMGLDYKLIIDESYLNDSYRSYRYLNDPLEPLPAAVDHRNDAAHSRHQ